METDSALKKLEKTYFEMIEKENYTKLSVSSIVSKAGVSRTTFYRHYVDIFDMHEKIAEKMADRIIEECYISIIGADSETDYFEKLLNVFNSQEKYIRLISGANGSRYFFEAMFRKVTSSLLPTFIHLTEDQLFRLRFLTISTVGSYIRDILDDREHNTKFIPICKKVLDFEEVFGGYYAK